MKEMKTLKFPGQEEAYEIVDAYAREQLDLPIDPKRLPEGYPYKEGVTIEWDGNTEGLETVSLEGITFYKVSDNALSYADLKNGAEIRWNGEEEGFPFTAEMITATGDYFWVDPQFAVLSVWEDSNVFGNSVKKGTYFTKGLSGDSGYTSALISETIHAMAPEFLSAAATAQADWNQNDETAPDYVNNRPFYNGDIIETVILNERTISSTQTIINNALTEPVNSSDYLTIIFDNTDYQCSIYNLEGTLVAGNSTLLGVNAPSSNNEPFLIVFQELTIAIVVNDENEHTISIKKNKENIIKINSKYLPNSNIVNSEHTTSIKTIGASSATGAYSFAEGYNTQATGNYSHAEGYNTQATGNYSHAEGNSTIAKANFTHVEGRNTMATMNQAHAEGIDTIAAGAGSHTEGYRVSTSNNYAHAEGFGNCYPFTGFTGVAQSKAFAYSSSIEQKYIAVGNLIKYDTKVATITSVDYENLTFTTSSSLSTNAITPDLTLYIYYIGIAGGYASHTEGASSTFGDYSHAEGYYTNANSKSQHVQGEYNIVDTAGADDSRGTYAHIVGNGTSYTNRSNAHTLDWSGNAWFAGDVYVGSTSGTNKDEGSVKLATEEYVDNNAGVLSSVSTTLTTSAWTLSGDRYQQSVSVAGVTTDAAQVIFVDCALTGTDLDADAIVLEAWGLVSCNNVTQGTDSLTFYAYKAPTVNIPVNVGV